jgi:hypothetical protein
VGLSRQRRELHRSAEQFPRPGPLRRKGIPLSLSIVYLLVAERLELELEPVGLPGHFVVGCFQEETPFFVDPFDKGVFRDAEEIFDLLRANSIEPKITDLAPTPCARCSAAAAAISPTTTTAAGQPDHARLFAGFVEEFEATHERHAT